MVLVYPEGRIGLDPWMWPERGKTGVARMAALSGAPVVPVAQWGTHRCCRTRAPKGLVASLLKAMWRRPVVYVRFGEPVDLSGLTGTPGAQAMRATRLIVEGIDRTLLPLAGRRAADAARGGPHPAGGHVPGASPHRPQDDELRAATGRGWGWRSSPASAMRTR